MSESFEPAGPATRGVRALRRQLGVLLVGGGAFMVTLGLLLHFQVYATLAVLPPDEELDLQLEDESGAYLNTATWEAHDDAQITRQIDVSGELSPGNDDWTNWDIRTTTSANDRMLDHVDRRVIVDRESAAAVNCCSEHVDGDHDVRQAGLVLFWPADAPTDDVPYYDADVRAAPQMRYLGTEDVAGLDVRRYEQTITDTQVPDSARQVPTEVLDQAGNGTVTANRWLDLTRTAWVEPVTGQLVHMTEERRETLRSEDGAEETTLLTADLELSDTQTAELAEVAENRSLLLRAVREWIPGLLVGLGPLLWAGATIVVRWGRR